MAASYEPGLETAQHAGLEPAPANYPEVYHQQKQFHDPKLSPAQSSPYPVPSPYSAAAYNASPQPPAQQKGKTICGCSLLVFILSVIIALLSAAVIGLAAGTGIQTKAVSDANGKIATLNSILATATAAAPGGTPTAAAAIDDGCDANPTAVTGTNYTAFSLLGGLKFTRYCGMDAKHDPLLALFVSNFQTCMDACAAYTKYVPPSFDARGDNVTCGAVSFIPAWTNKVTANAGGAPGNCYLKPGVQDESTLTEANIGTPCHAAVWRQGA